jgi:kexin
LKNGTLNAWSLSLWGESIDASKAVPYQLPSDDPDSDPLPPPPDSNSSVDLPPAATATKAHPKPTDHLPDDHGTAPGESNKPGLGDPVHPTEKPPLPTSTEAPSTAAPFATPSAVLDEGAFDGMSSLAANSTWVLGALAFIGLAGTGVGAFFFLRSRRRKMRGFGGGGEEGEGGGGYVGVAGEDDVAMGMLSGRRNGGGGKTKELYDAFGDGSSDESIDDDDGAALRYHE